MLLKKRLVISGGFRARRAPSPAIRSAANEPNTGFIVPFPLARICSSETWSSAALVRPRIRAEIALHRKSSKSHPSQFNSLAHADDAPPASHQRCLFAIAERARQTAHLAGMIDKTAPE